MEFDDPTPGQIVTDILIGALIALFVIAGLSCVGVRSFSFNGLAWWYFVIAFVVWLIVMWLGTSTNSPLKDWLNDLWPFSRRGPARPWLSLIILFTFSALLVISWWTSREQMFWYSAILFTIFIPVINLVNLRWD
ncbi:MAG: hypothetical protein M1324_00920 [Patescibacteria group bacterium]|nr:hypothetical protein [Patescibacteria group bacterium]